MFQKNEYNKFQYQTPEKIRSVHNPRLNILIRTTYRPNYFSKCIDSILSQDYQNFKIIICYDDIRCLEYLDNHKNNSKIEIFEVKTHDRQSEAFYNLYCNELLERVNDGWIMFLDDDDMFYSKKAFGIIANNLYTENDIIFWKVKLGKHIIYPKNINNIIQFNISSEGFIFNHKFKNNAKWDNKRSGDFRFITELLKNTKIFNRRFIDLILCGTQEKNIHGLLGKKTIPDSFNTFDELVNYYNIKQIYISNSLPHVNEKIYKYNLICKKTYESLTDNSIVFFGLYTPEDIKLLYSLKNSNIFLLFGGSEVENIKYILPIVPRIHIIAISKSMQDRLKKINIESKLISLDLTDKKLFYPRKSTGNCIYIYDGYDKNNPANEKTYGKKYYDQILKKFPNENFIFSSQLNVKHEKMPEIYAKCKIGLRLTSEDGNANTVQEFKDMNIPIVHNQSDYGLKWKTVDDIIKYIDIYMNHNSLLNIKNSNILINTNSNLNLIAGDSIMITNYMNLLMKNHNKITLLSKYNISKTFTRNLESDNYIVIIKENNNEIVKELEVQEKNNDIIFIRNHEILDSLKEKAYLNKTILYGLDIHLNSIKNLDHNYLSIITQSDKLKQLYIENNIPENKIHIIEPFGYKYDFKLPERNDNEIRLIYCGTLRDEENILEIIEEFQKIHLERPEVVLKIVYGKIHGDKDFTQKVNKYIKEGVNGITFKHNLTHRDACYEIATSDIGICWRKNGWGDNGEVSTKVKEYEMYGVWVYDDINNKNKMIICDEFTYHQFNIDNSYYYLPYKRDKNKYENIIKYIKPNILLVDSFWKGYDYSWSKLNETEKFETIKLIIRLCNQYNVKTYFWNKEDPISFIIWIEYAKLFDKAYTTDIDCIDLYKKNNVSNISVLPFLSNPRTYSLIKDSNLQNDKILFAGSWYSKYTHRCDILQGVLNTYKSNFVIFDRNYKGLVNNDKRYMYPHEFTDNVNPNIDISTLNKYYKEYKYVLNLNSVTESNSMCARRIFEILNSGGYPLSNYSNSLDIMFSGYLHYLCDNYTIKKKYLKKLLCCILHTLTNFLQNNLDDKFQIISNNALPSIAVLFYTSSDLKLLNINKFIECYTHQDYINKQCYIISNSTILKYNDKDGSLHQTDSISETYFTIFSDSLFYMKKYLKNFVIFQLYLNKFHKNIISTKLVSEEHLQDNKFWFSFINNINIFSVILNTNDFSGFVNLKFITDEINEHIKTKKIITLDPYNIYYSYNIQFCTEIQQDNFTGFTIDDINKINIKSKSVNNNFIKDILYEINVQGNYSNTSHYYTPPIKKIFNEDGIIYYDSLNEISLYCLNITTGKSEFIKPYTKYNIIKNHQYEFKWRFGGGKYSYSIKSLDYVNNIIINRSLVVITNTYPSVGNLYRNGFIHTRNTLYQDYLSTTVICLSPSYGYTRYVYENIVVYCVNKDYLSNFNFFNLRKLSIHFLDNYIYESLFLNKKFDNIEKNIFIHGSEIQPSHRRLFDSNYVKNGEIKDKNKKILWNNVTKHDKIKYVFVSKYFFNEVCEDYGNIFKNVDIIHNPVDLNNFNYIKKNTSQRKKNTLTPFFC